MAERATVAIVVDGREAALLAALGETEGAGEVRSEELGTGDARVGDRLLLERKTVTDLAASIRDGRWRDQLGRMGEVAADRGARIGVVVEGAASWEALTEPGGATVEGVSRAALGSALLGAFVRHGACAFFCADVCGTARLLRKLAAKVGKVEAGPTAARERELAVYRPLPRRRDGVAATPRKVAMSQLCCIPGVSPAVADRLLGAHLTVQAWLTEEVVPLLPEDRVRRVADVRSGPGSGSRRLGPALASRVLGFLLPPN